MVVGVGLDWHDAGALWHIECGTGRSQVSDGKRAGRVGVSRMHLRTHASDVEPASMMLTWSSVWGLTGMMPVPYGTLNVALGGRRSRSL